MIAFVLVAGPAWIVGSAALRLSCFGNGGSQ